MTPRCVLVLGGTGHVGAAVLRRLARAGVESLVFSFYAHPERAEGLPGLGLPLDLRQPDAVAGLFSALDARDLRPDAVVHAARLRPDPSLNEAALLERLTQAHAGALLSVARELTRRPGPSIRNLVALSSLDRGQSLAIPPALAAAQGALAALTMALGHELGPAGLRVNTLALGLLDGGAAGEVSPDQQKSYQHFSALRRVGTAAEVAETVAWLVLSNTVMNGKVIQGNGGI